MSEKSIQQWTTDESDMLIAIWTSSEIQDKLDKAVRKNKIYEEIRRELEIGGFKRTTDQITNKLKKIKKDYRDYKAESSRSGAGRIRTGLNIQLLDNVLGRRPANDLNGALNSATATQMLENMCGASSYEQGKPSSIKMCCFVCLVYSNSNSSTSPSC